MPLTTKEFRIVLDDAENPQRAVFTLNQTTKLDDDNSVGPIVPASLDVSWNDFLLAYQAVNAQAFPAQVLTRIKAALVKMYRDKKAADAAAAQNPTP